MHGPPSTHSETRHPWLKQWRRFTPALRKFLEFMLIGIPAFALAVPLNWFFVEHLTFPKALSYALVQVLQMTMNFVLARRFVFNITDSRSFIRQYFSFMAGNATIRFFDWLLYSLIVSIRPDVYLFVQLTNVFIFSIVKFLFARFIFRRDLCS
ncbi:MAG: hypothetical protein D6781_12310 [Verrucomicrobia bacterium]|nr:MAG: hypothetical protein D6781_12310 [Verrucomicrobiota bacterium]